MNKRTLAIYLSLFDALRSHITRISIFFLLILNCTDAQTENWKFYFTEFNDLPSTQVNTIAVDSNGTKWFGTNNGFASFDGSKWKQFKQQDYNLPENNIRQIVVDKNNCKWIATVNGLIKYNDTTIVVFDTTNSALPTNVVTSLTVDDSNNLWAYSEFALVKFNKDTSEKIISPVRLSTSMKFDKSGNLWFTGSDKGLIKYDGTNFTTYKLTGSKQQSISMRKLDIDTAGNIWIGTTSDDGIAKFDGNGFTFYSKFSNGNDFVSTTSWQFIVCDNEGNLWFNSENGLVKFNGSGYSLIVPEQSKVPVDQPNTFSFDRDGSIWLGTELFGAINIKGNEWINYCASYGLPDDYVSAIRVDNNNIKWIGTFSGLAKLDGDKWTVYNTFNSPLPHHSIEKLEIDKHGAVWIVTIKGLAKFDGVNWSFYTKENSELPDNRINSIAAQEDTIWVGTSAGLSKFYDNKWVTYANDYSSNKRVGNIAIDNEGNKWMLTGGAPIVKFDGYNWTNFTHENSGLPDTNANIIAVDNHDRKWIGTINGLILYNDTTWTLFNYENTGVSLNYPWAIRFDKQGNVVIGFFLFEGIVIYDGKTWTAYNTTNPSTIDSVGVGCMDMSIDEYGNKWIADIGLVVFNENGIFDDLESKYPEIPFEYVLSQNYPNPFNPETIIKYELPEAASVSLVVYNILGEVIQTLVNERKEAGTYEIEFNSSNLNSGVYFYRIITEKYSEVRKMMVIK